MAGLVPAIHDLLLQPPTINTTHLCFSCRVRVDGRDKPGHDGGREAAMSRAQDEIPVTEGSGNVFADLGFPDPEDALLKAQLTSHIWRIIKRRRLTQAAAARLMGIDQPKVSALLNGRLANFSSERLMRLLTALGQDVEITVRATPHGRAQGQVRVVGAETVVRR
jgi:predicted XRE-type DNA-binding protein